MTMRLGETPPATYRPLQLCCGCYKYLAHTSPSVARDENCGRGLGCRRYAVDRRQDLDRARRRRWQNSTHDIYDHQQPATLRLAPAAGAPGDHDADRQLQWRGDSDAGPCGDHPASAVARDRPARSRTLLDTYATTAGQGGHDIAGQRRRKPVCDDRAGCCDAHSESGRGQPRRFERPIGMSGLAPIASNLPHRANDVTGQEETSLIAELRPTPPPAPA
jgi:hypothetical protein